VSIFNHNDIRTYRQDERRGLRSAADGDAAADKILLKAPDATIYKRESIVIVLLSFTRPLQIQVKFYRKKLNRYRRNGYGSVVISCGVDAQKSS